MSTTARATIEGLYNVEGQAGLVDGEIVGVPPGGTGMAHGGGSSFRLKPADRWGLAAGCNPRDDTL